MNRKTWDKEAVLKDALKYKTIAEWRLSGSSAYSVCCQNKWNEEACVHMEKKRKGSGYWTDERVLAESQKFKTTAEWRRESSSSYSVAKRKKLVPLTMTRELIHGQWTKEAIQKVANDCKTRGELRSSYGSAYTIAISKGWLDDVCKHMLNKAPWFGPRIIREYLITHDIEHKLEFKFKDNKEVAKYPFDFYLPTLNLVIEYHGRQHKDGWKKNKESAIEIQSRDSIKKDFCLAKNIHYLELNLTNKATLIKALERELIKISELNNVEFSLDARELSSEELKSLETAFIWNYESVRNAISTCKTVKEFRDKYSPAHGYALQNGIWDELSKPLKRVTEHGKYTKEYVSAAAMECKTRNEFKQKHRGAWAAAQRNGWLIEVCQHMPKHMQKPWLN